MKLTPVLFFFLILASVVGARPYADGEADYLKACYKGEPNFSDLVLENNFPTKFLRWGYEKPDIIDWFLDYTAWEDEHLKYFKKNYGVSSLTFRPTMIVMHYTVVPTAEQTYSLLQRNRVTVQLMIAQDGSVYKLLPLNRRCTGAYGVNHKALSIEMVARTEPDLLSRANQVFSSFCLVKHLMATYDIPLHKVVAHSEVGEGVTRVPEYLDLADPHYPTRYPPWSKRTDPGATYMSWLRTYIKLNPPTRADV